MSIRENTALKLLMILMSLLFGISVFCLVVLEHVERQQAYSVGGNGCSGPPRTEYRNESSLRLKPGALLRGLVAGIVAVFAYPFFAAVMIKICEGLKWWAYQDEYKPWGRETRLALATIWPITLVAAFIIYIFFGVIHRLFDYK